ncbi:MAG: hypothetical protein PSV16_04115 [Flavobacterium sp.]|nr:hypothetical protein [Flavobacterium sp.]
MENYDRIIKIIDINLIFCLVPLVLSLFVIHVAFKDKFKTKKSLNLIRWVIIGYTTITLFHFVISSIFFSEEMAFFDRATGPYMIFYWLMTLSAIVIPFTLLIKKLGSNFLYVMLISFLMKIGAYFERFVIIVTSLHSDYSPFEKKSDLPSIQCIVAVIFLQGLLLAIMSLVFVAIFERLKLRMKSID